MLLHIPDVLTAAQVAQARAQLDATDWADGRITAGHQSAKAKDNAQLPEGKGNLVVRYPGDGGAGSRLASLNRLDG